VLSDRGVLLRHTVKVEGAAALANIIGAGETANSPSHVSLESVWPGHTNAERVVKADRRLLCPQATASYSAMSKSTSPTAHSTKFIFSRPVAQQLAGTLCVWQAAMSKTESEVATTECAVHGYPTYLSLRLSPGSRVPPASWSSRGFWWSWWKAYPWNAYGIRWCSQRADRLRPTMELAAYTKQRPQLRFYGAR